MAEFKKGIQWDEGDAVDERRLQQMVGNLNYLYAHRLPIKAAAYQRNVRTEGLRIASGTVRCNANKAHTIRRQISFGHYFSVGCRPIVIATPGHTRGSDPTISISIHGWNANVPDHRGFIAYLSRPSENKRAGFGASTYINWIAIGW